MLGCRRPCRQADDKGPVIPQAAAELWTAGAQVKPLGVGETLGCTSPKVGNVDAVGGPILTSF